VRFGALERLGRSDLHGKRSEHARRTAEEKRRLFQVEHIHAALLGGECGPLGAERVGLVESQIFETYIATSCLGARVMGMHLVLTNDFSQC